MITRIRELLEARQLSPTQFADLIGVGRPVISHILSERNKPSLEVVQKIIGAFPEISLPWLLAGTGSMLAAAIDAPSAASPASPVAIEAPPPVTTASVVSAAPLPPPIAPFTRPAAPARSVAVPPQPSSYPQPPRFRPGAAAPATPMSVEATASPTETPVSTANIAATAPASPPPSPLPTPAVAAPVAEATLVASAQSPSSSSAPVPTPPVVTEVSQATSSPLTPAAEALASPTNAETTALPPNPAAALSFLGEPGKAIRRIVIFYRDGSFSDYLPEGS